MRVSKVNLTLLSQNNKETLSDYLVTKCSFCQKKQKLSAGEFLKLQKISGNEAFFCGFCVRSGFGNRSNKDVLVLSFKNVFNHYYYKNYVISKKMWVSEIQDLVEKHKAVGLLNPVFSYDDESMNWFLNFLKIGYTKKKIHFEEVEETICSIIDSLNIRKHDPEMNENEFKKKYFCAVDLFYKKRYRPKNKKVISPTVSQIKESIF